MTTPKIALAALAALVVAFSAFPEGSEEKVVPVGPPQPRVVEALKPQPLPPRAADPSWLLYQDGLRLYGEKRLGESLISFQKAVLTRSELFERCSRDIAEALASAEAKKAKDSLSALVRLLAARDLIPQDYEGIRLRAGGSFVAEMGLLREKAPSAPLRGLLDAILLVVEERGISRVGDSLAELKRAVADLTRYPEAEFWMGKVYLAEGELRLAELQVRRALDMGESLELKDDRYEMLAVLAGIYKAKGDLKSYESSLKNIAAASSLFSGETEYYRNAFERTLAQQGFDKFMALYRVGQVFPVAAYAALGELYLEAGRPIATLYLAAAANAVLTRSIAEIKVDSPSYSYAGLGEILSRILADRDLAGFASDSGLWKDLVLLGESLSASGYRDSAREIWAAVSKAGAPAPWAARASESLARPPRLK